MRILFFSWLISCVVTVIPTYRVQAQARYLSIFGRPASGCAPAMDIRRMRCDTTPVVFTGIPSFERTSPIQDYFKNSAYDKQGHLLFSAGADGIYAADGRLVFRMNTQVHYELSCGTYDVRLDNGVSEVCIIPVARCQPNSYYVLCWCSVHGFTSGKTGHNVIRALKVDLLPAFGDTSVPSSSWYTIGDNLLGKQPDCAGYQYNWFVDGGVEIAADEPNTDGSRDIYTVDYSPATWYYAKVRRWHISPAGTLPDTSTDLSGTALTYEPSLTKSKIFRINGGKVLAYPVLGGSVVNANILETFDLNTGAVAEYIAPAPHMYGHQYIWGFEYLTAKDTFCFAFNDDYGDPCGLAYAPRIASGTTILTVLPATREYKVSDMELTKNGDLCLVRQDSATADGFLTFIPKAMLTGSVPVRTALSSPAAAGDCMPQSPVSVESYAAYYAPFDNRGVSRYLASQVRGDDYDWGADIPGAYFTSIGNISGISTVCIDAVATLGNNLPGGTWHSSSPLVATVDSVTGLVHALSAGTAVITYQAGPYLNGCTYENVHPFTVNAEPTFVAVGGVSNVRCHGEDNGRILIALDEATPPIAYAWSNGSTDSVISGLSPGSYSVTVSETARNCHQVLDFTITQPDSLLAVTTVTADICQRGIGSVAAEVKGGTKPYKYLWSEGSSTATVNGLQGRPYSLAVTDRNGCGLEISAVVADSCIDIVVHDLVTPNGDGYNDVWVIEGIQQYPTASVEVFDKSGELVYRRIGYSNDWGGTGSNRDIPDGTYFYVIRLNLPNPVGSKNIFTGSLFISR